MNQYKLLVEWCRKGKIGVLGEKPVPVPLSTPNFTWILLVSHLGLSGKMLAISHLNRGMGGSHSTCLYVAFLYLQLITLTYFKCLLSKNHHSNLFSGEEKQPNPAQWTVKRSRDDLIFQCFVTISGEIVYVLPFTLPSFLDHASIILSNCNQGGTSNSIKQNTVCYNAMV